jgi:hypothetical protein
MTGHAPRPKPGLGTCPSCGKPGVRRKDLSFIPHQRWADGAGSSPDQPHTFTACPADSRYPSHVLTMYTGE